MTGDHWFLIAVLAVAAFSIRVLGLVATILDCFVIVTILVFW
jgi:hypothetical protein